MICRLHQRPQAIPSFSFSVWPGSFIFRSTQRWVARTLVPCDIVKAVLIFPPYHSLIYVIRDILRPVVDFSFLSAPPVHLSPLASLLTFNPSGQARQLPHATWDPSVKEGKAAFAQHIIGLLVAYLFVT